MRWFREFEVSHWSGRFPARAVSALTVATFLLALCLPDRNNTIASAQAGTPVDVAIVLAVDVSYSVNIHEYRLQMRGLANAFQQDAIHNAITRGPHGRIAVAVMQWSDEAHQLLNIPWTIIDGAASAQAYAETLYNEPRKLAEGGTSISAAIAFGALALENAPVVATRRVIDVSADGRNNRGPAVEPVRDRVAASGITINGLAILNEWPTLNDYFERTVIGGPYHFVVIANDYDAYAEAIYRKLLKEITGPGLS